MPATTIESPRLSPATRRQIAAQHADAVHRLLAAEGATLALTAAAVDDATRRLVDAVVARGSSDPRDAERSARKAIQDAAAYLGPAFVAALVNGRREAREQSRGQVGVEMGLLAAAMRGQDQEPPALDPAAAVDTSSDETWAAVGGSSMVAIWGAAAIALVGRWKAKGGRPAELPRALRGASPAVASAVERHAVTQSAAAYAEQHRALWDVAIEARSSAAPDLLAEPGLPHGWTEGVLDVWSAILDRKTCPVCWSLDGQMVPLGKPFMGAGVTKYVSGRGTREAALHPRCRCLIITTVIPEMLRRRLPGAQIDFAALKDDIREYFESASADSMNLGRRHALPFIQDSLAGKSFSGTGRGTSPEALARALQRRNFTTGGAPGTPGASARRAGRARKGRQMRLEDPRTAAVRRFPDSEGPVRTPAATTAPAAPARSSSGAAASAGGPPPAATPPSPPPPRGPRIPPSGGGAGRSGGAGGGRPFRVEDFDEANIDVLGSFDGFQAAAKQFFGAELSPATVRRLIGMGELEADGFVVRQSVSGRPGLLTWDGVLYEKGVRVGTIAREAFLVDGEVHVHHALFKFADHLKGKGLGPRVLRPAFEEYFRLGVPRVYTEAAWTGQYYWPSIGFRLTNPASLRRYVREYWTWLESKGIQAEVLERELASIGTIHDLALHRLAREGAEWQAGKEFLLDRGEKGGGLIELELDLRTGSADRTLLGRRLRL